MTYFPNSVPLQVAEADPISQHYVAETLLDTEDIADDTYYYYIDMAGFRKAAFQFEMVCTGGTMTVTCEGTLQDDGTAQASCDYQDVTSDVFGVASLVASAGAASDMWIDNSEKLAAFKYVRIKLVVAGGADADATFYAKRLY